MSTGTVTEFAGEASAGKTQLALQLLLQVQLPTSKGGLDGAAVYISTEGPFPSMRLAQLAREFGRKHQPFVPTRNHNSSSSSTSSSSNATKTTATSAPYPSSSDKLRSSSFTDSVYLLQATDIDDLDLLIATKLPVLADRKGIRLVVLDSIAAVMRGEFDSSREDLQERSCWMWEIAGRLKRLAYEHNVAVVVMNQATSLITSFPIENAPRNQRTTSSLSSQPKFQRSQDYENSSGPLHLMTSGVLRAAPGVNCTKAALGPNWTSCVNTRIMLHRTPARLSVAQDSRTDLSAIRSNNQSEDVKESVVRLMWVLFSPRLPHRACRYVVEATGVRGIETLRNMDELLQT